MGSEHRYLHLDIWGTPSWYLCPRPAVPGFIGNRIEWSPFKIFWTINRKTKKNGERSSQRHNKRDCISRRSWIPNGLKRSKYETLDIWRWFYLGDGRPQRICLLLCSNRLRIVCLREWWQNTQGMGWRQVSLNNHTSRKCLVSECQSKD